MKYILLLILLVSPAFAVLELERLNSNEIPVDYEQARPQMIDETYQTQKNFELIEQDYNKLFNGEAQLDVASIEADILTIGTLEVSDVSTFNGNVSIGPIIINAINGHILNNTVGGILELEGNIDIKANTDKDTIIFAESGTVEALTVHGTASNAETYLELGNSQGTRKSTLISENDGDFSIGVNLKRDAGTWDNYDTSLYGVRLYGYAQAADGRFSVNIAAPTTETPSLTEVFRTDKDGITTIKSLLVVSPESTAPVTSGTPEGAVWCDAADSNTLKGWNGSSWQSFW